MVSWSEELMWGGVGGGVTPHRDPQCGCGGPACVHAKSDPRRMDHHRSVRCAPIGPFGRMMSSVTQSQWMLQVEAVLSWQKANRHPFKLRCLNSFLLFMQSEGCFFDATNVNKYLHTWNVWLVVFCNYADIDQKKRRHIGISLWQWSGPEV